MKAMAVQKNVKFSGDRVIDTRRVHGLSLLRLLQSNEETRLKTINNIQKCLLNNKDIAYKYGKLYKDVLSLPKDFFNSKLSVAKLANVSYQVFKTNFKFILYAGLLLILPFNLILILIPLPSAADIQNYLLGFTSASGMQSMLDSPEAKKLIGYSYSIFAAAIVFTPLSKAVCAYLAKSFIDNEKTEFSGFIDSSIGRWGKHIVTSVIYNIMLVLGAFLIIFLSLSAIGSFFALLILVPIIAYGVGMSFYTVVAATQDKWGIKALRESYGILKRNLIATTAFLIGVSLSGYLFSILFAVVFSVISFIGNETVVFVLSFIGGVISDTLKLFFQIVSAVWFLNRAMLADDKQGGEPDAM